MAAFQSNTGFFDQVPNAAGAILREAGAIQRRSALASEGPGAELAAAVGSMPPLPMPREWGRVHALRSARSALQLV